MRNKAKFIEDFEKVAKPEIFKEVDPVQDAAHTMNHTGDSAYVLEKDLTTTGKDETFNFEVKNREKTDDSSEEIEDYFYIGKGGFRNDYPYSCPEMPSGYDQRFFDRCPYPKTSEEAHPPEAYP